MTPTLSRALSALLLLWSLTVGAAAQEAPDFQLDLDTGGHRAFIKDLAVTPDGNTLISASDDKTIRIWDWRSGQTIRTLRGYMGLKNDGKVFAVAVSPDGKTVAAGGYFGAGLGDRPPYGDIRLFDLRNGKMTAVLRGHEFAVYDIAFSPDGGLLAAGGQDGFVYLWKRDAAAAEGWTAHKRLDADSWHIERVAFAAGGTRLVATTTDNGMRLWDMAAEEEVALPAAEVLRDTPLRALAVSPDGSRFATGNSEGAVQVWNAADGAPVDSWKADFLVGALSFAGDGRVVASCGYRCADRNGSLVFELGKAEPVLHYRGHDGTVYASTPLPDGLMATAGGTRHEIRVWNPATGMEKGLMRGPGSPVTAVAIDARGSEIAWGNGNPCPERFACPEVMGALDRHLLLPTKERAFERPDEKVPSSLRRALLAQGGWALKAEEGGADGLENAVLDIARDGHSVRKIENDAARGYLHGSFTLLSDGEGLVTGGNDGTMIAYDRETGSLLGEFLDGHTGELMAMAEAPQAKLMVTGAADQTIRLWNLATRELVASMFFAGGEFIIWVPQGYYYSSPDGDALVGWHVNDGRDHEARYVKARQLKQYLFSPEIVRRAIMVGSARQAVEELRGPDKELARLLQRKPPEFSLRLAENVPAREGFVSVEITGADEAGADVASFNIQSNEKRIDEFTSRAVNAAGGKSIIVEVPVSEGENEIRVSGVNEFGYVTERSVKALARKTAADEKKGKLYVVAIGVEKYPLLETACNGRSCDLRYPVDDAVEFLSVLKARTAPLFSGMETLVLLNREALDAEPGQAGKLAALTKLDDVLEPESDNISDHIEDFLDRPGPDDTTVVFVAGHGINIDEDYYFIPSDGRMQDKERWRRSSLVDWSDVQKAVERAKGRRIMLLDTCHAGNAFNPKLEKDTADARIIVFSATAANNTAAELPQLGHGVFTYSLLEGLKGAAGKPGDGVRLLQLAAYVYDEVVRLTAKKQEPFYHISQTSNFLLAQP